jgi:putative tryptophan/tyrosine transport system substrate-binding protein
MPTIKLHKAQLASDRTSCRSALANQMRRAAGNHAMLIRSSPLLFAFRRELCRVSRDHGLAVIGQFREMPEAGCLMSYGATLSEMHDLAADLAIKMLKGARPHDTPALQPTRYELVINLSTARSIGIEIPPAILSRADGVIE